MTIHEPFRFWANEMPVANVIRRLRFHLMLAFVVCASSITMQSHPAKAGSAPPDATYDAADRFSQEWFMDDCDPDECRTLKDLIDPGAKGVGRFHLELSFDPTQFKFDPRQSGPLCSFADGGTPCPPPRARLGTSKVREDNTPPGIPPAGSTLCFSQPRPGVVVVDYALPTPVDLSTDQNVFVLSFDLITPIPRGTRVFATYFGEPGDHQFNLIASECNGGTIRCVGEPSIPGVDISIATQPNLR